MIKTIVGVSILVIIVSSFFIIFNLLDNPNIPLMKIRSTVFEDGGAIPSRYTCDAENINPTLEIGDIPKEAESLALIMEDPDAPVGTWIHWLKWNLPPDLSFIDESSDPGGISGRGSAGNLSYIGPCPPDGVHRYFFRIFALDTVLDLAGGSSKIDLMNAMSGHILAEGELMGTYQKQ